MRSIIAVMILFSVFAAHAAQDCSDEGSRIAVAVFAQRAQKKGVQFSVEEKPFRVIPRQGLGESTVEVFGQVGTEPYVVSVNLNDDDCALNSLSTRYAGERP